MWLYIDRFPKTIQTLVYFGFGDSKGQRQKETQHLLLNHAVVIYIMMIIGDHQRLQNAANMPQLAHNAATPSPRKNARQLQWWLAHNLAGLLVAELLLPGSCRPLRLKTDLEKMRTEKIWPIDDWFKWEILGNPVSVRLLSDRQNGTNMEYKWM